MAIGLGLCLGAAHATHAAGTLENIAPPLATWSRAGGLSVDGSRAAGVARLPSGTQAFLWDAGGARELPLVIPSPDPDDWAGHEAEDARLSDDGGTVIVGVSGTTPFYWTIGGGMRPLGDVLGVDDQIDLSGWELLDEPGAADGHRAEDDVPAVGRRRAEIEGRTHARGHLTVDHEGVGASRDRVAVALCVDVPQSRSVADDEGAAPVADGAHAGDRARRAQLTPLPEFRLTWESVITAVLGALIPVPPALTMTVSLMSTPAAPVTTMPPPTSALASSPRTASGAMELITTPPMISLRADATG